MTGEKVDILIVDDVREDLIALKAMLDSPDYRIVTATSGAKALKEVLRCDFAVILLDVVMPVIDGFEFASLLKMRERSAGIPIIFLSAMGRLSGEVFRGYSVGAVDCLPKPVEPNALRAKVSVFAELFRKSELIRRQGDLLRIRDRKASEARLERLRQASEERYRSLADAIPQIVWTAEPGGAVDYYNWRWFATTGLELAQIEGGGWTAALHPDDVEPCVHRWNESLASGAAYEVECRLRSSDGSYRWHLGRALAERDRHGSIVGWIGTFTDVDDHKRAIASLDEFKTTLDAVLDCVWIFDPDTLRFLYVNEGAVKQLGYSREELAGMTELDVDRGLDRHTLGVTIERLRSGASPAVTLSTRLRRKDGSTFPVDLSLQLIRSPGTSGRLVSIIRDMTERQRADEERTRLLEREQAARAEAERALAGRDEFLSIASHELKTPLTTVTLQVETLLRPARKGATGLDPGTVTTKLEVVERQLKRLTGLVDDLLDVSRIAAGQLQLEPHATDLGSLARDVLARYAEELTRAGCRASLDAREGVVGKWDRVRLEQVLLNLLSNAAKYGKGSPIEVTVGGDGDHARLSVRDHGIGIEPGQLDRIFGRFERAVSARSYGGLGLGLYIARQIVGAHGGTIRAWSEPGSGALFSVELPRAMAREQMERAAS